MLTFLVCLMFEAGSAGLVVPVSFLSVRWEELVWVQNAPNKKRQTGVYTKSCFPMST